jgi:carboxymethylenebutenolidase
MVGQYIESGYLALPESGSGPGLLVLADGPGASSLADHYAEEGYVALAGQADAIDALKARAEVTGGSGALAFGRDRELARLATGGVIDVAIGCDPRYPDIWTAAAPRIGIPVVLHVAENPTGDRLKAAFADRPNVDVFTYPGAKAGFALKDSPASDKPAASMAASRTIAALRRAIGPQYDLAALWEEHCLYEFGLRDVPKTMATMVAEPYVNHIPTMTGGVGHKELSRFYQHHFVNSNPKDTRLVPVSRTIGTDRLVDEMLFCFTHDVEIDWMLPGVKPTGKYVEVPLVAIINFRGDKLYHEHIYWDQASVLAQIGLLDPKNLPIADHAQAQKLIDETRPSNTLMARWPGSENK